MMSEVGPVFIRSCLAQANFECDDIVTIDRYEPDVLAICTPAMRCQDTLAATIISILSQSSYSRK